jgi:hypothetical protein
MAKSDKLKTLSPQLKPAVEPIPVNLPFPPDAIPHNADDVPRETLPKEEVCYSFNLTVIHPFDHYTKGTRIRDAALIKQVIEAGHLRFCAKTRI